MTDNEVSAKVFAVSRSQRFIFLAQRTRENEDTQSSLKNHPSLCDASIASHVKLIQMNLI
jgi:hypothetical protein